jgi:hypothetical protein
MYLLNGFYGVAWGQFIYFEIVTADCALKTAKTSVAKA